jgi:hypothetical protein
LLPQSDLPSLVSRVKWIAIAIAGAVMMAIGSYAVLFVYAFATMVDPRFHGWDRRIAILKEMFLTPSVAIVMFGTVAVGVGACIGATSLPQAFGIRIRRPGTIRVLTAFAMIVFIVAILLIICS